jgi:hypothetical protein
MYGKKARSPPSIENRISMSQQAKVDGDLLVLDAAMFLSRTPPAGFLLGNRINKEQPHQRIMDSKSKAQRGKLEWQACCQTGILG